MNARIGDEIMIIPRELHEPVREGHIRETIAYDLGVAEVRINPLGPSAIRLELLPHDGLAD
jgi:hypothetical protein